VINVSCNKKVEGRETKYRWQKYEWPEFFFSRFFFEQGAKHFFLRIDGVEPYATNAAHAALCAQQ
jgi:hypothetical protein